MKIYHIVVLCLQIFNRCRCRPFFIFDQVRDPCGYCRRKWLPFCTGRAIKCMEEFITDFGKNASIVTDDADKSYAGKRCLPSCEYQVQFSTFVVPVTDFDHRLRQICHRISPLITG